MMGISHAATGLLTGGAIGIALSAEPAHLFVCAAVGAGAALLPDLDTPSSTASNSLDEVTRGLSRKISAASSTVYRRTATQEELQTSKRGSHRHLTHTVPACLTLGLTAFLLSLAPLGGALVLFALTALGLGILSPLVPWGTARQRRAAVLVIAGIFGLSALLAEGAAPAPWLVGVTVTVGALTHILGDWLTHEGVPLAWPLIYQGSRWWMFKSPLPFTTGKSKAETAIKWGSPGSLVALMASFPPPPPPPV